MIRAFIIDDEQLAIERLKRMLVQSGRVDVVGARTDPEAALEALSTTAVDVLFLDIQMPGMTGFDVLERIDAEIPVIFTTAYDEYALQAFSVNSIDYLLKPVDAERLDRALDKLSRLSGPRPDVRALARALASQLNETRRLERIPSRVGDRTTLLDVARISHFVARDKLTYAVAGGRDHVIDMTLSQLEEQLDARRFIRIHRSTIVNATFVVELQTDGDGALVLRLRDGAGTELSVARDRERQLKERLGLGSRRKDRGQE
jgi:two-component system, LytTR family, response regulator